MHKYRGYTHLEHTGAKTEHGVAGKEQHALTRVMTWSDAPYLIITFADTICFGIISISPSVAAPLAAHGPPAAAVLVVNDVGIGAAVVKIVEVFAGKGVGSVDNACGGVRVAVAAVAGRAIRVAVRRCQQVRANALRCCHRVITGLKHCCHESESSSITKTRVNAGVGARCCDRVGTNLTCCRERTGKGRLVAWDPGGKPAREEIIETKGPVEANKNDKTTWWASTPATEHLAQVSQVIPPRGVNHTPYLAHTFVVPSHCQYCT